MLTGGGAMHLNDAFGRRKELRTFFNHHEQASSIAAESYFRVTGKLRGAATSPPGPGGVNALNGVYGAYVDSIGMVVISGQVKRETYFRNYPIASAPARRAGDRHRLHGARDHQVRGHPAGSDGGPGGDRKGGLARQPRPAGAHLGRHPDGRSGRAGRSGDELRGVRSSPRTSTIRRSSPDTRLEEEAADRRGARRRGRRGAGRTRRGRAAGDLPRRRGADRRGLSSPSANSSTASARP